MSEIPQHRLTEMEARLLVLYTLEQIGPCCNLQLITFMAETELMNYFELQQTLYKLRDGGQVSRSLKEADDLYTLTQAGKEAIHLFIDRTHNHQLELIERVASDYRERFTKERELSVKVRHEQNDAYHLMLGINEMNRNLLTIDLSLPTAEMAKQLGDRWQEKAQVIYDTIIRELAEEKEQ